MHRTRMPVGRAERFGEGFTVTGWNCTVAISGVKVAGVGLMISPSFDEFGQQAGNGE